MIRLILGILFTLFCLLCGLMSLTVRADLEGLSATLAFIMVIVCFVGSFAFLVDSLLHFLKSRRGKSIKQEDIHIPEDIVLSSPKSDAEQTASHWLQRYMQYLSPFGIQEADFRATRVSFPNDKDTIWSLMNQIIQDNPNDFHVHSRVNRLQAMFLDEEGRDYTSCLEAAAVASLTHYKTRGIKQVTILTAGEGNACNECLTLEGDVFAIEEALSQMPLPHKSCTKKGFNGEPGFCRCMYFPYLDEEE
jgi:hypothetical protein